MALNNNLYPDIQFEEIIEIPRPNQVQSNRRLGIVGKFRKGPWNSFRLISTYDDLLRVYGASTDSGSVGVQVAMDQGADDFGIVRVMGAARFATGAITVTGTGVTGTILVTVNGNVVTCPAVGTTPVSAGAAITAAINADPVVNLLVVAVDSGTGTVNLRAVNSGLAGNSITYSVALGTATGFVVGPLVSTNLSGGLNGPVTATYTLLANPGAVNWIEFRAKDPGAFGNDIKIKVTPSTTAGYFDLLVTDTVTLETEQYFDLNVQPDALAVDTDDLLALTSSAMIRATYVGSNANLTPVAVNNQSLSGGTEGPALTDDDFSAALNVLADEQVNYIMAPGQTSNSVRAALLAQAENSEAISGFRVAILNADKGTALEDLETMTSNFNTTTGSGVMVTGWFTYARQPRMSRFSVSPDCAYAGHLVATPAQASPAARSSSPFFQNILEVDTKTTGQAFNAYTKARLEAIVKDPATGGFHCLNGRTLASDTAWYWVSIRRVTNQIKSDVFNNIQWAKSQPNSTVLRNALGQQLDSLMQIYIGNGVIAATKPSVVDLSNNPLTKIAQGYLRAEVYFAPYFPADHITVGVRRFLAADVAVAL